MQFSSLPTKFQIPFGNSAANINTIPQASQIAIKAGAASLTDGFPPACFLPVGAGGIPPWGSDFNGLFNQITQWTQWQNAGGQVIFDATFSTAVTGYPNRAIVASGTANAGLWMSIADNNTNNPDSTSSPGNNWIGLGLLQRVPWFSLSGATGAFTATGTFTQVGPGSPIIGYSATNSSTFNSTVSTTTGSVVIGSQDAGVWFLSLNMDGQTTAGNMAFWININNVPVSFQSMTGANVDQSLTLNCITRISSGQSISAAAINTQSSPGHFNTNGINASSIFSGFRVGASV